MEIVWTHQMYVYLRHEEDGLNSLRKITLMWFGPEFGYALNHWCIDFSFLIRLARWPLSCIISLKLGTENG